VRMVRGVGGADCNVVSGMRTPSSGGITNW
jgi:hypothetical protein